MNFQLPTQPVSWIRIIALTVRAYFKIFVPIFWLVLISALVHLIIPWIFRVNIYYGLVGLLGFMLLIWFLYTAVLHIAQIALKNQGRLPLRNAFVMARKRYLLVLGSNIIFFAIGLFLVLIEYTLNLAFDIFHEYPLSFFVSALIDIYLFIYLYFAIPSLILDNSPIIASFERSVHLVRYNWWRTLILLGGVGLVLLGAEALGILITGKERMILFTLWHFMIQVIFYPLIVALTLVLYHDLTLRLQQRRARAQARAQQTALPGQH
ncbi:MAG: hypothetical protein QM752_06545 [Gammaproteobacteria bacterium]